MTPAEIADYQRRVRELAEERKNCTLYRLLDRGRPSQRQQAGLLPDEAA